MEGLTFSAGGSFRKPDAQTSLVCTSTIILVARSDMIDLQGWTLLLITAFVFEAIA